MSAIELGSGTTLMVKGEAAMGAVSPLLSLKTDILPPTPGVLLVVFLMV